MDHTTDNLNEDFENTLNPEPNDNVNFTNRIDLSELQEGVAQIRTEISKVIVGQKGMIDMLIASILANGHSLIEGVPGVAKTISAKLLAKKFKSIDNLISTSESHVLEIDGIGHKLAESLLQYFKDNRNIRRIEELKTFGLNFETISIIESDSNHQPLVGLRIIASGKLKNYSRDSIVEKIESLGGTYVKAISSNIDFVIEGEKMGPAKKDKAIKLGLKIITEEEFDKLIDTQT